MLIFRGNFVGGRGNLKGGKVYGGGLSMEVEGGWRRGSPVEEFMLVYVEKGRSMKEY